MRKNKDPLWIKQCPLIETKLDVAHQLVEEQLQKDHIEPSTYPWNSPIFVIKEKSGKWHLLTDLWEVNSSMYPMDALQPGIPSPTMLPYNWPAIVTNLYDCFFTIPVYPNDIKKICFFSDSNKQ